MSSKSLLRGKYLGDRTCSETCCTPQKICFMMEKEDSSLITLAKVYGLPIVDSELNNNQIGKPERGTIYVINEFENNPVLKNVQDLPGIWIIGPTFLKESVECGTLVLRNKPSYCMSMKRMVFHINCPGNITLMKRMVQLIKWMGGLFVKSPNCHLTHMVSTSTRAKGYEYCSTFNVPILTPQFVEHCWQQRNIVGFKADIHTANFILPAFADLYICFIGFDSTITSSMESLTKTNGGTVVTRHSPICTHMVCNDDYDNTENIAAIPSNIYLVNPQWFWKSLDMGQRLNEEGFNQCFLTCPLSESYVYMDVNIIKIEESRNHEIFVVPACDSDHLIQGNCKTASPRRSSTRNSLESFIEESSILLRKDTKKKYNFEELVLTELNYLNHLKALVNLKHAVLNAEQPGGPVLPKNVAKIVFCNFEKIYKIHQKLAEVMKDNLSEWENNVTPSMKVIIRNKSEMLEEYEFYSKNVEVSQEAYQQCENENYHFRELTYLHRFDKIDIKDVFVRPFQRMCSISLLLGEMKKNIREKSEDRESLSEAINIIKEILDKMNMEKRETDKLRMIFNIFYSIENCPNDLITSRRDFIVQFFAQEITKRVDSNNLLGINLSFFLFGDILVITKLRKSQSPKPYKYLVTLSLCMIVKILLFEKVDDTEVFGFVTRNLTDENKTTTCCFQYVKKDRLELNDVLLMIAKQISLRSCQLSAEDYIVRGISTSRITVQSLHNTAKIKSQSGLGIVKLVTQKLFGNPKSNADEQNIKFRRSRSCSELNI